MNNRFYQITIVDDEPDSVEPIMTAAQQILYDVHGYKIQYNVFSRRTDLDKLEIMPSDIVMFDCSLSGADFIDSGINVSKMGFDLIKKYRAKNRRTKVIFYSGRIKTSDSDLDLTSSELLAMINELNVFRVVERSLSTLKNAIAEAIDEMDAVLICLESLAFEYEGVAFFNVDGKQLKINELVHELKMGTKVGDEFRATVINAILMFLMTFKGEGQTRE
jgi:CheY-like chemotaxis protein